MALAQDPLQDTLIAPFPGADLSRDAPAGRGEHLFNLHFLPLAAGQKKGAGLGPLFNRNACSACHPKGGRGKAPSDPFEPLLTALVRLSVPGVDGNGAPVPHPAYGTQLNTRGVRGVPGEAEVQLSYDLTVGAYDDGEPYKLRKPSMAFDRTSNGPLDDALTSLRIGQPIVGLGLLEAIPEEELLSHADPEDADGNGISGRPNRVWHHGLKKTVMGRFGWKSNEPDLVHQTAAAFLGDIGITSPLFPVHDCGLEQAACREADGTPELTAEDVEAVAVYLRALSPPEPRTTAAEEPGARLFQEVGCALCHRPQTGVARSDSAFLDGVAVMAYTDLLLHDMGEGLADGRPDFEATGREWRTPPLWGLGRLEALHGDVALLHDGRAQSIEEAILWHGGEGAAARDRFKALSQSERQALIGFLKSL